MTGKVACKLEAESCLMVIWNYANMDTWRCHNELQLVRVHECWSQPSYWGIHTVLTDKCFESAPQYCEDSFIGTLLVSCNFKFVGSFCEATKKLSACTAKARH